MKKTILFALFAASALLICGCRVISHAETPVPVRDSRSMQTSGMEILTAIQKDNYKDFLTACQGDPNDLMTEKEFRSSYRNIRKQFGELKQFRFLAELRTPAVGNMLYLVTFERNDSKGKPVIQDLLFRIVFAQSDGTTRAIGMGFL